MPYEYIDVLFHAPLTFDTRLLSLCLSNIISLYHGHLCMTYKPLNMSNVALPSGFLVLSHTGMVSGYDCYIPILELRRLRIDLVWCYKIVFGLVRLRGSDFFISD